MKLVLVAEIEILRFPELALIECGGCLCEGGVRHGARPCIGLFRRPLCAAGIVVCNGLSLGFERRQFRNELLLGLLEDLLRVKVIDLARWSPSLRLAQ